MNKPDKKESTVTLERKNTMVKKVKTIVYDMLQIDPPPKENYSIYISNQLQLNYTYIANIFSEVEKMTIEHYIIGEKIEKSIQLLLYGNYSISEIADILHYSSIGHYSSQFKKVKGKTPTQFKKEHLNKKDNL